MLDGIQKGGGELLRSVLESWTTLNPAFGRRPQLIGGALSEILVKNLDSIIRQALPL